MRRALLLLIALMAVPIAELYVIYRLGDAIGILPTIVVLIVDSLLGMVVLRAQSRAAWRSFNEALVAGRPPAREVLDGVLVIVGGALLLTPGFLTDALGLTLLAPPTRALYRRFALARMERRLVASLHAQAGAAAGWGAGAQATRRDSDVDGEAVEVDQPELGR